VTETTRTSRAQARLDTTEAIKRIAREHLASDGPDLSLRAVARDLGMVSSAVYRYFASRDELLTALILDGYAAMADAVEAAEADIPRRQLLNRWLALGRALREWSLDRPHEYALLYGSPVPGYRAPRDTVDQAQRPVRVAMRILADGIERGVVDAPSDRLPRGVRADVDTIAAGPDFAGVPTPVVARALSVWAQLFGTVSFELFGRFGDAITDWPGYFDHELRVMARHLGLP
jgi:AcrR family transcriptional regulator